MFLVDIVTGASQGIGLAIAEMIAHKRQLALSVSGRGAYTLILVGRNTTRGAEAAAAISAATGLRALFEQCDVSEHSDVVRLRRRISQHVAAAGKGETEADYRIGVLVNSAAECPQRQELVVRRQLREGAEHEVEVDRQFGTNVLGYHFMMRAFVPNYSSDLGSEVGSRTRILNVASNWAGDLDLTDLNFRTRPYDNDTAYRQSKQADRMLSAVWSSKLQHVAVVNSCHPGDPCTTLSCALGYNTCSPPPSRHMVESETPIPDLCGLGKEQIGTGGWYEGRGGQARPCRFASLKQEAAQLFDLCDSFCI